MKQWSSTFTATQNMGCSTSSPAPKTNGKLKNEVIRPSHQKNRYKDKLILIDIKLENEHSNE